MSDLIQLAHAPIDWIDARERFAPPPKIRQPIDVPVSKLVGKTIYSHDPRLMKLIVKWKGNKPQGSTQPDNFLRDPEKVKELIKVLSQPL